VANYLIEGVLVKTDKASYTWVARHSFPPDIDVLHRSRRGSYYLEHLHPVGSGDTSHDWAEWISPESVFQWLTANQYEIPRELADAEKRTTSRS
jgi:hypothetical protein